MVRYQVRVERQGVAAETVEVGDRPLLVGREAGDIVLRDPQCSSRHLELSVVAGQLKFKDLGSTNGTFINGARVAEKVLAPGEALTVGQCKIVCVGAMGPTHTVVAQPALGPAGTQVAMPAAAVVAASKPSPSPSPSPKPSASTSTKSAAPKKPLSTAAMVVMGAGGLLAVVLVWAVAVSVFRGGAGGTMSGGEAQVHAVWFRGEPGTPQVEGGTSPITVRIAKNTTPGASVGVIEEYAGGTGAQWRTATWQAAFNASRAAGITLVDHEYLVRAGGHIDGPSAGMLITATMLALLRGDHIDPQATMTGTVNPDGTAGPVGGIVQKMGGAKAAGKLKFGYPVGTRNHTDLATMKDVDLEAVGASLGLQVKEINDLPAAYEFLTGITLEMPAPVDENAMALDADSSARLRAKIGAWKGRTDREIARLKEAIRVSRRDMFASSIRDIEDTLKSAETLEKSDMGAAALNAYATASLQLAGISSAIEMFPLILARDYRGVQARIDAARAVNQKLDAFDAELKIAAKKESVGGYVNVTAAMVAATQASAVADFGERTYDIAVDITQRLARGELRATPEVMAKQAETLIMPVVAYIGAEVLLDLARDKLDLVGEEGQARQVNLDALAKEAGAYGSAASATVQYFDSLEVQPLTERGLTLEQARAAVAKKEFGYRIAVAEAGFAEHMAPTDTAGQLRRLAAGLDAFLQSSRLVNGYYALGGRSDDEGNFEIRNRKALTVQLDLARTNARIAAAQAQAEAGFIPRAARLAYQSAAASRDGSDAEKLTALVAYWESAHWSELATRLSQ